MSELQRVTEVLAGVQYMNESQARNIRQFMLEKDLSEVLEVGFYTGKSSAYIASVIKEMGKGHLTTIDLVDARARSPNIEQNLAVLGYADLVTPLYAERSHTWELKKLIEQSPRPQFDLCYFDGGHTWDVTGFGFVLVDMLLRPGGWIIFDDLNWTIDKSVANTPGMARRYTGFSVDEKAAPGVRLVFETVVPHLKYRNLYESGQWGYAQKPV